MASISLKYKSKSGNLTAPGDVDPGAMIPIATVTVGAGGSSSISFTSIPSVYEHLQIRAIGRTNRSATGGDYSLVVINNDASASNYSMHQLLGNSVSALAGGYPQTFAGALVSRWGAASDGSGMFGAGIIDILDYSNTNKYKTIRSIGGLDTNSASSQVNLESNLWMNTSAISSLAINPGAGTSWSQYSHFALYGIKRAGA
jgi:hypothetical protein